MVVKVFLKRGESWSGIWQYQLDKKARSVVLLGSKMYSENRNIATHAILIVDVMNTNNF